jgi:hypothetical protein
MCPFCPRGCSVVARAHGSSNPGLVKNGPPSAGSRVTRPGIAPPRLADAAPGSLDQWSRPSSRAPGARPESPFRCRHAARDPLVINTRAVIRRPRCLPGTPDSFRDAHGGGVVFPERCWWRPAPLEAASPLGTLACGRCPECQSGHVPRRPDRACQLAVSGCARFGVAADLRGDGSQRAGDIGRAGQAGARAATAGPGARGRAGYPVLAPIAPTRHRRANGSGVVRWPVTAGIHSDDVTGSGKDDPSCSASSGTDRRAGIRRSVRTATCLAEAAPELPGRARWLPVTRIQVGHVAAARQVRASAKADHG